MRWMILPLPRERLGARASDDKNLLERLHDQCRQRFPFTATIQHLALTLANVARTFSISVQSARHVWVFHGFLDAEQDWLGRKQSFLRADGLGEGIAFVLDGSLHQVQQGAPVHGTTARKMAGPRIQ